MKNNAPLCFTGIREACTHAREQRMLSSDLLLRIFFYQVSSSQRAPRDLNFPYTLLTRMKVFFLRLAAFRFSKPCPNLQEIKIFSIETIKTMELKNPKQTVCVLYMYMLLT